MRTNLGSTWFMQLMILFILIFAGYIILTLNYSRTIKIKNEAVAMIEKYEGMNDSSIKLVNDFFINSRYETMGVCVKEEENGVYGLADLNSTMLEPAEPGKKYYYCMKKFKGTSRSYYYQLTLFYEFNLPFIGNTGSYTVRGTTTNIHSADSDSYSSIIGG